MAQKKKTRKQTEKKRVEKKKQTAADEAKVTAGQGVEDLDGIVDLSEVIKEAKEHKKTIAEAKVEGEIRITSEDQEQIDDERELIAMSPEFPGAALTAMAMFDQFIVYEQDAPEEARIMLFPAFMHITREDVKAEILTRYAGEPSRFLGTAEDAKIIVEGIDDAVSILKKRTDGAFPMPSERGLTQLEYSTLSELAWIEAALFYRIQEEDLLRGHIRLSSGHALSANQPLGSRFRSWVSVQEFTKQFFEVLKDDTIQDKVMAMVELDQAKGMGYARYFLRWREAEKI